MGSEEPFIVTESSGFRPIEEEISEKRIDRTGIENHIGVKYILLKYTG